MVLRTISGNGIAHGARFVFTRYQVVNGYESGHDTNDDTWERGGWRGDGEGNVAREMWREIEGEKKLV